jgi:hypothetical protein
MKNKRNGRKKKKNTAYLCVLYIYIYVDAILCCVKISLCSFVFFYLSSSFSNILFFSALAGCITSNGKRRRRMSREEKEDNEGVGWLASCVCVRA